MSLANSLRGEAGIVVGGEALLLRPTFGALVAAEQELGPLFALVERAGEAQLRLEEIAALFDHLAADRPAGITRARIGEAITAMGLAKVAPILRRIFEQILKGQ